MPDFAVCRERDKDGNPIVIATITNNHDAPLPEGFIIIPLPASHQKGDVLPGDVWQMKGRAFEKKSDQRAAVASGKNQ